MGPGAGPARRASRLYTMCDVTGQYAVAAGHALTLTDRLAGGGCAVAFDIKACTVSKVGPVGPAPGPRRRLRVANIMYTTTQNYYL